jgi:hypothetical protein
MLMVGGLLLVVAAAVLYTSLDVPWVDARLSAVADRAEPRLVGSLTFHATDGFAGKVGLGLAIAFVVFGLVWFWYSLDRGVHLPTAFHPGLVLVGAVAAWIVGIFAALGYFFWDDAFVTHARAVGLSRSAMSDLLAERPAPIIDVQLLAGVTRFRMAATLALLAGVLGAWATRRRYR